MKEQSASLSRRIKSIKFDIEDSAEKLGIEKLSYHFDPIESCSDYSDQSIDKREINPQADPSAKDEIFRLKNDSLVIGQLGKDIIISSQDD